jgi:hypothetical protein
MLPRSRTLLLPILLLLCSCPKPSTDDSNPDSTPPDDSSPDTEETGDTAAPLGGACPDATRLGRFMAAQTPDYAYVMGSALDGVVPVTVRTTRATEGECVLLQRDNPFCDPPCEANETCDFDGQCIPYPTAQDIGVVTVDGLLQPVSMEPMAPSYSYYDTSLPNPPWEVGALLTLETGGGAFDAVTLQGVAPTALASDDLAWEIVSGDPLAITWEAAPEGALTQVRVTMNVDLHGVTPAAMECWFTDDGEGEVPAALLEQFLGLGITGFPEASFARVTADQTPLGDEGCMDFWTSSSLTPALSVDGYTPCTSDDDCPDGQECNEELERCE